MFSSSIGLIGLGAADAAPIPTPQLQTSGGIRIKREAVGSLRTSARYVLAAAFVATGTLHFVFPSTYARIVPPTFGHADALVYVSGVCEILGGIGVLLPPVRKAAGIGLIALLIAVFPANIYMALHPALFATIAPPVALDARLPLQAMLIAWVYWCCF